MKKKHYMCVHYCINILIAFLKTGILKYLSFTYIENRTAATDPTLANTPSKTDIHMTDRLFSFTEISLFTEINSDKKKAFNQY